MNAKIKKLYLALMEFHNDDEKKVKKAIIGLYKSNDISADDAMEIIEELDGEDNTRAKTVSKPALVQPSYDAHVPTRRTPPARSSVGNHGASNDRC